VGRSHECDFPAGVEALPAISEPRLDPRRGGREIHDRVEELVSRGLSIYEIDAARLRELRPDVILTQTLCEVCAATPEDLAAALAEWTGAAPAIVSLSPLGLDDVLRDVERSACARARRGRRRSAGCARGSRPSPAWAARPRHAPEWPRSSGSTRSSPAATGCPS
jgi:iron complex transport system substrate-binding protein